MPDSVAPATEEGEDEGGRGGRREEAQGSVVEISREGVKERWEEEGDGERRLSASKVRLRVVR